MFQLFPLLFCILFGLACGSGRDYKALERKLAAGQIEEVERELAGLTGQRAVELRERCLALRLRRDQVLESLAGLVARRESSDALELLRELRSMFEQERDPLLRARLEREFLETLEWAAARPLNAECLPLDLPGRPVEDALDASLPLLAPGGQSYASSSQAGVARGVTLVSTPGPWPAGRVDPDLSFNGRASGAPCTARVPRAGFHRSAPLARGPEALRPLARSGPRAKATTVACVATRRAHARKRVSPAACAEHCRADDLAEVEAVLKSLLQARAAEREGHFTRLRALCAGFSQGRTHAVALLEERWQLLCNRQIKSKAWKDMEPLQALRIELGLRRQAALELIRDEARYFALPEPGLRTPEQERSYHDVQTEVLRLVAAVREVWQNELSVRLPPTVRADLGLLAWLSLRVGDLGGTFQLPEELPPWLLAQDYSVESMGLKRFALDLPEQAQKARDQAIVRRNEDLWGRPQPAGRGPTRAEMEQVRLTNSYRQMMGLPVLAWNAKIYGVTRLHSEYMAQVGSITHSQPDPGQETFAARLASAGYALGVAENCYYGSVVPGSAHDHWLLSSMHHRNILLQDVSEMASGLVGIYWTQNYGSDTSFEQELDSWRD